MSGVPVAVALPPEGPLTELVELAVEAEGLGCRTLWVNDDRSQPAMKRPPLPWTDRGVHG